MKTQHLRITYSDINLSGKFISNFLKELGRKRVDIVKFLKAFITPSDQIIFDMTPMISNSKKLNINEIGYNSAQTHEPQVNLLYVFSVNQKSPSFYRILPGNIRDVSAFKLTSEECDISKALIVADKGFYSEENISILEESELQYIVPLRRNNKYIKYDLLKSLESNHFFFNKEAIWYWDYFEKGKRIVIFLKKSLAIDEESDYLYRLYQKHEGYTLDEFSNKKHSFGTLSVITNLTSNAEEVYKSYKARGQIESIFDTYKNNFHADRIYVQNEYSLRSMGIY